jgi:signal transduction histidine kinase
VSEPREAPDADVLLALNRSTTAARLLSGVIHEINNALQVISGTVELLEARTDMPPATKSALDRLNSQSTRMAATLSDVQRFTRAPMRDTGTVNLREVAEHSASLRMFAIRRAGLSIHVAADPADLLVTGNRGQLQQAVLNLIANAEQSLAPLKRGSIQVHLEGGDDWVTLRVADEGPGVAIQPREAIFEPFTTTRDPWEGAGLGLWAARRIAEAHGGTVTVEGETGNVFALRLPRSRR